MTNLMLLGGLNASHWLADGWFGFQLSLCILHSHWLSRFAFLTRKPINERLLYQLVLYRKQYTVNWANRGSGVDVTRHQCNDILLLIPLNHVRRRRKRLANDATREEVGLSSTEKLSSHSPWDYWPGAHVSTIRARLRLTRLQRTLFFVVVGCRGRYPIETLPNWVQEMS